jgi:hypothetical protein
MPSRTTSEASLIYNANKGSKSREEKRDYRYERRSHARKLSVHDRFRKCGCTSIGPVSIGLKGDKAQQRGLYTCGSVWVCPVCSAKVLQERKKEVEKAIRAWTERGGSFVFETLTISHRSFDTVAKQRLAIQAAWAALNKGSFKSKYASYGQQGYLRIAEVTHGKNGEHLHLHVLRFIDRWLPSDELDSWKSQIFEKWANAIEGQGLRRPSSKFHDFQQIEVAEAMSGYFTKNYDNPWQAAGEILTDSAGTSIWRLLDAAIANPKSTSSKRWNNYEVDTRGMKQMTWSRGLRADLGLKDEELDEAIAAKEEPFEAIIGIHPESVRSLGSLGRIHSRVLYFLESGDLGASLDLLDEHGIKYSLFPYESPPPG